MFLKIEPAGQSHEPGARQYDPEEEAEKKITAQYSNKQPRLQCVSVAQARPARPSCSLPT
jgi:hypothetical protein